jgi:uncharacterized protein (TIGR02646 family)
MIKLQRNTKPSILDANESRWKQALLNAVSQYGSFKDIPEDTKEKLLAHYRHKDIQSALTESSSGKCAFCECIPSEGGNIEIEHFKPKSIYPDLTFDWTNLLPSCRKCNGSKSNHDTATEPIVNPYDTDPADIFYYEDISIKAKTNAHFETANRTIEVCGLENIRLWKPRADILVSLRLFTRAITEAVSEYSSADTPRKRENRRRHLQEAISTIESLTKPKEKYSGFCKYYLDNCKEYSEAKRLCSTQST